MKEKLENIINFKCRQCGSEGKWDIWLSGSYKDKDGNYNWDKQTINCRNCEGRLL